MRLRTACTTLAVCLAMSALGTGRGDAGERPPGTVPPSLEIEVLDPGVDPLGNPAVVVQHAPDGRVFVDIPPVVLVHRYYYTGDRSFQAQMLPGGPSIVVVNHPQTGQRYYIPVQMLPGAPRVTYTAHDIEYDYGENGITIHFGLLGEPTVKFRSGVPLHKRVGQWVHAEHWHERTARVSSRVKCLASASRDSLKEAAIDGHEVVKSAALPFQNLLRLMPLGAAAFDPNRALIREEKIAKHRRDHAAKHAAQESLRAEQTIPTIR